MSPTMQFLLPPRIGQAMGAQETIRSKGFLGFNAMVTNADERKPEGLITMPTALIVAFISFLAVAVILFIAILVLSKPKRKTAPKPHGVHSNQNDKRAWRERIDDIVERHARGELTRDAALRDLAQVARDFASVKTGKDMSTYTLADINHLPVSASSDPGMKLLRQTINALYPPEFADAEHHVEARSTSVEQAAEWVSNLIERWRK